MKSLLCALILIPGAQLAAQNFAAEWFPISLGNRWVYAHEVRDGSQKHPNVSRWQTVETITGTSTTPDGLFILRRVEVKGDRPRGWLETTYGESSYLIWNDCLYFLDDQIWNKQEHRLRPGFREQTLAKPQFCFPMAVKNNLE